MLRPLALSALLLGPLPALAYSSFPPTDHVGIDWPIQPPPRQRCTVCHTTFGGPGTLALQGLPAAWEAGRSYSLLVEIVDPSALVFGFETTALLGDFRLAGTIVRTDLAATALVTDPDRVVPFLLQTSSGNLPNLPQGRRWGFDWVAPARGSGPATFHVCANAGNNDATAFGDRIYCLTAALPEQSCAPPLPAIRSLQAVRLGTDLVWSWIPEPLAAEGYRLYAVGRKQDLPLANQSTPAALRSCTASTPGDASCSEAGAAGDPGPLFYQLVAVCAGGYEGPN